MHKVSAAGKLKRNDGEYNRESQKRWWRQSSTSKRGSTEEQIKAPSGTTLNDLPMEILDIILQKSCLHWILNSPTKFNERDEEVIKSLTSVDVCFYRRITRQRIRNAIWRYLKDFYEKNKTRTAMIRNNQDYLLCNIQPNDEFIDLLLSFGCITEEQRHFIQRQLSERDKNAELLHAMRPFNARKYSNFVKCLRKTDQSALSRVVKDGGVVIKVKVKSCGRTTIYSELHDQRATSVDQNIPKPMSYRTHQLIDQLMEEGIEILNSKLDKETVVVWIWCHSQAALANLQRLYESNQLLLTEALAGLAKTYDVIQSKVIIDRSQFRKAVVTCPKIVDFNKTLDMIPDVVHGVTKLRNEIYVLGPHRVSVFEDRNPFHHQRDICIRMESPTDIVSSETENCLYVSDSWSRLWKIRPTREADDQHKVIECLKRNKDPLTMSVSANGQLLIIAFSRNKAMIYGTNVKHVRTINLPINIEFPRHAVKTSFGNYIILYHWRAEEGKGGQSWTEWIWNFDICELTRGGEKVIRHFMPSNKQQTLERPEHLSIDSDDRVFVADCGNGRVILLGSDLKWNRILCPTKATEDERLILAPHRLCYDEKNKQLIVGGQYGGLKDVVHVFNFELGQQIRNVQRNKMMKKRRSRDHQDCVGMEK